MRRATTLWLHFTSRQEYSLKHLLLRRAGRLGPSVARLVQAVWADSILETARDIHRLLRISRRCGPARLEAACRRASYYRRDSNCFTIEWILEKGYDKLPLSPYSNICGQFLIPFTDLEDEQPIVESETICEMRTK